MILKPAETKTELKQVKKLYNSAFPKIERKTFSYMQKTNNVEILAAYDSDGEFSGLAITILGDSAVVIDYLAVSKQKRGHGIGTKILDQINKRYNAQNTVFLEIERPNLGKSDEENKIRNSRYNFYLKNGYEKAFDNIIINKVKMWVLSHTLNQTQNQPPKLETYLNIYKSTYGEKYISKYIKQD